MSRVGDQRWRDVALCRQTDPEIFFPEKGAAPTAAKKVCANCPVRAECLADALEQRDGYGVRGGLSANERNTILRQHTTAARARAGRAA